MNYQEFFPAGLKKKQEKKTGKKQEKNRKEKQKEKSRKDSNPLAALGSGMFENRRSWH